MKQTNKKINSNIFLGPQLSTLALGVKHSPSSPVQEALQYILLDLCMLYGHCGGSADPDLAQSLCVLAPEFID